MMQSCSQSGLLTSCLHESSAVQLCPSGISRKDPRCPVRVPARIGLSGCRSFCCMTCSGSYGSQDSLQFIVGCLCKSASMCWPSSLSLCHQHSCCVLLWFLLLSWLLFLPKVCLFSFLFFVLGGLFFGKDICCSGKAKRLISVSPWKELVGLPPGRAARPQPQQRGVKRPIVLLERNFG